MTEPRPTDQNGRSDGCLTAPFVPRWAIAGAVALLAAAAFLFVLFHTKWVVVAGVVAVAAFVLVTVLGTPRPEAGRHAAERGLPSTDRAYLAALITLGLGFCIVFGPGTVPDESYHFYCTYKYSDALLGQTATDDTISVRTADRNFFTALPGETVMDRESYEDQLEDFEIVAAEQGTVDVAVPSPYPWTSNLPQVKWAPVLGVLVARLLNLGPLPLFYLGRLCNLAYYILLCWAAVRLTPVAKGAFRVVSLLPMSLHLAASYSYDTGGLGLMLLLTALLLKAVFDDGPLGRPMMAAIPVAAFLTIPCKVIYLPVMALVFFIPASRFESRRTALLYKAGCLGAAVVALAALRLGSIVSATQALDGGGEKALAVRGDQTGRYYSIGELVADPAMTVQLYVDTLQAQGNFYLYSMWGGSLGWFQPQLVAPQVFGYCFYGILFASALRSPDDETVARPLLRAVCLAVFVIVVLASLLALATSFTFDTESVILGVQGRYFIPVLPLLLLAVRGRSVAFTRPAATGVLCVATFLDLWYLLYLYGAILAI
ncbi:DUF2142 domain-containing protein [Caniella muris]|uniref:DUF2142 domain-containing protein n=1 Tax=Caniella muris TaxID=2941502 RepID=UPI00203A39B2|nr:DUF2142 domain-containing protein [Caniella muris]